MQMTEAVRLVIWDLDDTFWQGTLSEGGIDRYIEAHHDIVIALARRGIMSSICSKNDFEKVRAVLAGRRLWDYFIFPSIDWTPKGERIAALIDQVQLRPPTVLFIDDNPGNLAEAKGRLPELQTAGPEIITTLLDHPLLIGKDDADLTRLAQYKLLERRQGDQHAAGGDNAAFLRKSGIKLSIETDIRGHLDRAIELINRTNQLNFTKKRLPEDPEAARAALLEQIEPYYVSAGLIRVTDLYGDYGYCGFYCQTSQTLTHFCFSCRILGMGVERWLYRHLGRPRIAVTGEVLTDLDEPGEIDWIDFSAFGGESPASARVTRLGEVRLHGGCELDTLSHYFRLISERVEAETNRRRGFAFIHYDVSTFFDQVLDDVPASLAADLGALGYAGSDFQSGFLAPATPGTVLIHSAWSDHYQRLYHHRLTGLAVPVDIGGLIGDLTQPTPEQAAALAKERGFAEADIAGLLPALDRLRADFTHAGDIPVEEALSSLAKLFAAVPDGATLFHILAHEKCLWEGRASPREAVAAFNRRVRALAADFPAVRIVDINDCVHADAEMQMQFDHFDRIVYFRLFERIMAQLAEARPDEPM